ncbi:aspartate/glutamate racemase family protein [Klebsiella oxytoca]|uniref:aspartate/glutamate racemase family protein n=1 Tax=Klebsiella TaxID=570 RepID=UPI0007B34D1F|nr:MULTISPECIES: aspartate/glutamate racemase family protein [Klebsiella]EAN5345545.1 aspartate racemase [Salmonella enterica]EDC9660871.1 aspartate racemase [Salmonella enterica subsp. enterica serovar Newport]EDI4396470.1 aspartate racemase [Salmonella enterica subsp. enterica serovar Heidelberg]EGI8897954.1 aspartate racemase [Escherichia coli]EAN5345926.1 aspartate racemase [Salmonella enterica]
MSVSVGILAGMGPRSTAPFIEQLINACQELYGAKYDIEFPHMHIISLPTPFWPGRKIDEQEMMNALRSGIVSLKNAGVSLIAVPCNLAHRFFIEMQEVCMGIPLIHIADGAVTSLPDRMQRVALIATEPTLDAGFYQARLQESGKQVICTPEMSLLTTALIAAIKEKGYADIQVHTLWTTLVSLAEAADADAVLIACTDISPLAANYSGSVFMIDTAKSLAYETIRNYMQLKRISGIV